MNTTEKNKKNILTGTSYHEEIEREIEKLSKDDDYKDFLINIIRKSNLDILDIFTLNDLKEQLKDISPLDIFDDDYLKTYISEVFEIFEIYDKYDIRGFILDYLEERI